MKRVSVAVMPGDQSAVSPPPVGCQHLRLSYAIDESEYDEGMRKVGRLVKRLRARTVEESQHGAHV